MFLLATSHIHLLYPFNFNFYYHKVCSIYCFKSLKTETATKSPMKSTWRPWEEDRKWFHIILFKRACHNVNELKIVIAISWTVFHCSAKVSYLCFSQNITCSGAFIVLLFWCAGLSSFVKNFSLGWASLNYGSNATLWLSRPVYVVYKVAIFER